MRNIAITEKRDTVHKHCKSQWYNKLLLQFTVILVTKKHQTGPSYYTVHTHTTLTHCQASDNTDIRYKEQYYLYAVIIIHNVVERERERGRKRKREREREGGRKRKRERVGGKERRRK